MTDPNPDKPEDGVIIVGAGPVPTLFGAATQHMATTGAAPTFFCHFGTNFTTKGLNTDALVKSSAMPFYESIKYYLLEN